MSVWVQPQRTSPDVACYMAGAQAGAFIGFIREYPTFELIEGADVLLDVSSSGDGVLEVALHGLV